MNTETLNQLPDIYTHIYIPIGIWLIFVILLLTALIIRFTFGKWTKERPNPHRGETLDIPRGVFRGILTLTLLFCAVLFEVYNLKTGHPEENIIEFLTAFKMMIAFYFGAKVAHHVTSAEKSKSIAKAEALTVLETTDMSDTSEEITESTDFVPQDEGEIVG